MKGTDMSETTQEYFELGSKQTNPGFQSVLDYIRENARSERQKGDLFRAADAEIFQ